MAAPNFHIVEEREQHDTRNFSFAPQGTKGVALLLRDILNGVVEASSPKAAITPER
jgi:hypothetical protein